MLLKTASGLGPKWASTYMRQLLKALPARTVEVEVPGVQGKVKTLVLMCGEMLGIGPADGKPYALNSEETEQFEAHLAKVCVQITFLSTCSDNFFLCPDNIFCLHNVFLSFLHMWSISFIWAAYFVTGNGYFSFSERCAKCTTASHMIREIIIVNKNV